MSKSTRLSKEKKPSRFRTFFSIVSVFIAVVFLLVYYSSFGKNSLSFLVNDIQFAIVSIAVKVVPGDFQPFKIPFISIKQKRLSLQYPAVVLRLSGRGAKSRKVFYLKISLLILLYLFFPVLIFFGNKKKSKAEEKKYIRGTRIVSLKELKRSIKRCGETPDIPISKQVKMPREAENLHLLIIGRSGTGKTQTFLSIMNRVVLQRNEKAIIYDIKGDYITRFKLSNDIVFNPFDARSVKWTIFNEIKTETDIDNIAKSFIPENIGLKDPFWSEAARDVFASVLRYCIRNNEKRNAAVWDILTKPANDLYRLFSSTPGCEEGVKYFSKADSSLSASVLSITLQMVKIFKYLGDMDGDFSIRDWVRDASDRRKIYLNSVPEIKNTLRPLVTALIDIAGRGLLSMPDDRSRRVFFMLDEFPTLHQLSTIAEDLLPGIRSKGGCIFIGTQDIGLIQNIYGPNLTKTIINGCASQAFFGVSDPSTAKFISDKIGEAEYVVYQASSSDGDYSGVSEVRRVEPAILPSELLNLPELEFYLKLANHFIVKTKAKVRDFYNKEMAFVPRNDIKAFDSRNVKLKETVMKEADLKELRMSINTQINKGS